ncbi:MAG: sugar transferase [Caulobacteraceae bacterium]
MYQFGLIEGDQEFRSRGGLVAPVRRRVASPQGLRLDSTRVLDIAIALAVLVFTAPLLIVLALTIKLQDGGPALFAHPRIGRGGRTFRCLKFRSMVIDAEARLKALLETDPRARREWDADHKLRKDPRLTPMGDFLRKSSLDELPQLFNVLRGEMSIVGPRPIVQAEVVRYGPAFRHYCSLRPGITGLWQVSGRNDVSYRRRVALDRLYAGSKNLKTDLKILVMTVPAVLSRNGSY